MEKEKKVKKDTEKEIEKTEKVDKKETKEFNIKKVCKRLVKKLATTCKKIVDKTKDYVRFHKNQVVRTLTSLGILVAVVIIAIIAKNIIVGAGIGNIGYPIIYQKSNNDVYMLEHGADVKDKEQVKKMQSTGSIEYSNTSSRYILFKNNTDLYVYDTKKGESTKVIDDISYSYGFTPKDTYIYGQDSDSDLYIYDFKEAKQLLDNDVTSVQDYNDKNMIYEKNSALYFISFDVTKEDRTKLVDGYILAELSENGKYVLYTNTNNALYRYDVKKDKHTKIASDVESFYCDDSSCDKLYYIQNTPTFTLKYYSNSKEKQLTDNIYDIVEIDVENRKVLYTVTNENELSLYYLYKNNKPTKVTDNYDYGSSVVMTENAVYYVDNEDNLMYSKLNGSSVGKAKKIAKEVQSELYPYEDGVYYYKSINENNDATYYIASGTKTTKIADDISRNSLTISNDGKSIYYMKDMASGVGTLNVFDGKKSTKISEEVKKYIYIKEEGLYYITDYNDTTKTGTLYRYDGKKTKIDTEVNYIIETTPNAKDTN
ncbi:MAG: hypothetical protein ACI4OP_00260 [Candidatus Coprovivens sp.]